MFELGGVGFCVREHYAAPDGHDAAFMDELGSGTQQCSVRATDLGRARLEAFEPFHRRSDRLWQLRRWRWQKADAGDARQGGKKCRGVLLRPEGPDGLREFLGISELRGSGP